MLYVNNEKIEQSQIDAEVERLRPNYENYFATDDPDKKAEYAAQLEKWSRENVIERVLFAQIARCRFADIEDDQKRVEKLIESISSDAPKPMVEQAQQYYNENQPRFISNEMVRASHIVKHPSPQTNPDQLKEQMHQLLWEIRNNDSFDKVASEHSDCPENAGDLGYFYRGQMVPEFEEVVFNMEVGDISNVFQTQFGFHIAKVTDKIPSGPVPFEQVKQNIMNELAEELRQKAVEDFIDAAKLNAVIEEKDE